MIDYEEQRARRNEIVHWLKQRNSLSVAELTARLAVSRMTIHRDLDFLVREGLAAKRHGWVELIDTEKPIGACADGRQAPSERTRWDVILPGDQRRSACCPACGFRRMKGLDDDARFEVRDALTGRQLDGRHATYVIGSRINLCCWPSVLVFGEAVDAASFQRGFGGQVATFAAAYAALAAVRAPEATVASRAAERTLARPPVGRALSLTHHR
jgi:hypothetical protein